MRIRVNSIREIRSQNHGGPIFRLDGTYQDEFNETQKLKVFVDPKHDNFEHWHDTLKVIASNRGHVFELENCRFKNREKAIINGDSKPQLVEMYPATN